MMKLENRYIVIKRKDLRESDVDNKSAGFSGSIPYDQKHPLEVSAENIAKVSRDKLGKPPLSGIFIESDWPEYPKVLKMLSDRVDGNHNAEADAQRMKYLSNGGWEVLQDPKYWTDGLTLEQVIDREIVKNTFGKVADYVPPKHHGRHG